MTRPTPKSPKCTTIFALANEDKPLNKRWFIIVYVYGKRVKHQPCKYVYIILGHLFLIFWLTRPATVFFPKVEKK